MRLTEFPRWPVLAILLAIAAPFAVRGQAPAGPFTDAQADAGRTVYEGECARCHGRAMQGGVEEPPLRGARFLSKWKNRTTHDLFNFIQTRMPPQSPGGQGEEVNLQLVAHILRANGATAGPEPLTPATELPVGSLVPDPDR